MAAVNTPSVHLEESTRILHTVTHFIADMHMKSPNFRDFSISSPFIQELLFLLFPFVIGSDIVSPETELLSRDSSLTFNGDDVVIRPLLQTATKVAPIVRTASVETPDNQTASKIQPLKRGSSYVLVTTEQSPYHISSVRLRPMVSPKGKAKPLLSLSNSIIEQILEIIVTVFSDQIFSRKDFPGIGLFMKVPPGFQEHQAYFESFILRKTMSSLQNALQLNQKLLCEPRVLTNLARFSTHLGEAIYEGWFIDGAVDVVDFLGEILECLQRSDVKKLKSVRLCSEIIASMRTVLSRVVLFKLSESDDLHGAASTTSFLKKLSYWQTVLIMVEESQEDFLKLLCYLLYTKLIGSNEVIQDAATDIWRSLLVQKPDEISKTMCQMLTAEDRDHSGGFQKILELDNASFLNWFDHHRTVLDTTFMESLATFWEEFVATEDRRTEDVAKARIIKRRERLKVWVADCAEKDEAIRRHENSSDHWRCNIHASERLKRQRSIQDQQDSINFNIASWRKMVDQLNRPCGLLDTNSIVKWQLDQTEGRNRMRLRLIPDKEAHLHKYQPKGGMSRSKNNRPALAVHSKISLESNFSIAPSPINDNQVASKPHSPLRSNQKSELPNKIAEVDDGFEIVDEPREESEFYEDKNRKVMRSLQRSDQVECVLNVSRIVGLEACEGLLIVGKNALYLLDNFFQRSDGEIVDTWQAPSDERDSYMQMISGREMGAQSLGPTPINHDTRSWLWDDVLSISKRRFLLRDVAIEIFFVDGQSFLLAVASSKLRDELHQKLFIKSRHIMGGSLTASPESLWRIESLATVEDKSTSLGSRLTNVFNHNISNPATRKWMKGEMSNFHYLMLVNTMAGRTFNDLTQYPIFPWVLADYSSEELDLNNPRAFRDLTQPMGCQSPEREAEFRERYRSFADMGDDTSPPFHYGTHYSSAMIVTSYLIRLQPFVQSYLLLQGGSFDHPDRLFYSIEKAWLSASRDNMTDVRELIPEFYYLPDFLLNSNGYEFGFRQGNGGSINTVALPPWAKGNPAIFISKHREALESDHVSRHLHRWIDLIFGCRQRGEAALESANVFHHLSYQGAKNLDAIEDPVERLATIGIIHNFGQTPQQIFQRAHPPRDETKFRLRRLDTLADSLTRLPFPLLGKLPRLQLTAA